MTSPGGLSDLLPMPSDDALQNLVMELGADGRATRQFSYADLPGIIHTIWHNLRAGGVQKGQLVFIICDRPLDVILLVLSCLASGCRFAVFAHPSPKLDIDRFAEALRPALKATNPDCIIAIGSFAPAIGKLVRLPVIELEPIDPEACRNTSVDYRHFAQTSVSDPLFYQFSSGTTGAKKAVAIDAHALHQQVTSYSEAIDLQDADVIVNWLPYYHDMGLITGLLLPILTSTPLVTMSPFDWIAKPALFLEALHDHRGTLAWLPNFAFQLLAQKVNPEQSRGLDLSSVRGLINCSEPITEDSFSQFIDRYRSNGLAASVSGVCYAMAETTFAVTSGGLGKELSQLDISESAAQPGEAVGPGQRTVVSSGPVVQGTKIRISDGAGGQLDDMMFGEIHVQSSSAMTGYLDPDLTARKVQDGWYQTGDLGFQKDGELFVLGRLDDLLIVAGRNYFPEDAEAIASSISGIVPGRAMCFGTFDEGIGTQKAVLVAEHEDNWESGTDILSAEIRSRITAELGLFLTDVRLVPKETLHKTSSGKIPRNDVRARYLGGDFSASEKSSTPSGTSADEDLSTELKDVLQIYRQITGDPNLRPDDAILTSGVIDSLTLVNLLVALEEHAGSELPHPSVHGYGWYDSARKAAELLGNPSIEQTLKPHQMVDDRHIKLSRYLESERDFSGFILGSSRSYGFDPRGAASTGHTFFNMSVAGLRCEELFAISKFLLSKNKTIPSVVFIGLDPETLTGAFSVDQRFIDSHELFAFLPAEERMQKGHLEFPTWDQNTREGQIKGRMRFSGWEALWEFDPQTGGLASLGNHRVNMERSVGFKPEESQAPHLTMLINRLRAGVSSVRADFLRDTIDEWVAAGTKVISYDHPWASDVLRTIPEYEERTQELWQVLDALESPDYFHFKSLTPDAFGGSDDDFFDARHMASRNYKHLAEEAWRQAQNRGW